MRCPYCGDAMEAGVIQSAQEINWHPGRRRVVNAAWLHPDSLVLSRRNFLKGSAVEAWMCRRCGKIIIDSADPRSDRNQP